MSIRRNLSLKRLIGNKECKKCKILSIVKSGFAIKSPPLDRILKDSFHRRWFTLGIMDVCCSCNPPEGKRSLMLSYYEDNEERIFKGRFNIDNAELHPIDGLPAEHTPDAYSQCKHTLKWEIPHHARRLYMILETEIEQVAWIRSFEALLTMLKPLDEDEGINDDNDGNDGVVGTITDTRLQTELAKLRNSYSEEPANEFTERFHEDQFTSGHSFKIGNRTKHNSTHDSGISTTSESSSRTSYFDSRASNGASRYSQSPRKSANSTILNPDSLPGSLAEEVDEQLYVNRPDLQEY